MEPQSHDPQELAAKRRRIDGLLREQDLDALLLLSSANVAWASGGGRSYISEATEGGVAALLFRRAGEPVLLTNTIERDRLLDEEVPGLVGAEEIWPWYEGGLVEGVRRVVGTGRLGADLPGVPGAREMGDAVTALRASLLPVEVERYRWLGRRCGLAVEAAARGLRAGMTEQAMAAAMAAPLRAEGISPIVLLVASDERLTRYRHPLPTEHRVERAAMLVVCGRRWGLIANVTRMVHLGPLPDDLRQRHAACVAVDAAMIAATQPGAHAAAIFEVCVDAYARAGYDGEWRLHHQGGAAGYAGRDWTATPTLDAVVVPHQAFAWNPSITGTKSEDTFVLDDAARPEFLTATGEWPLLSVTAGGLTLQRPVFLEVDG